MQCKWSIRHEFSSLQVPAETFWTHTDNLHTCLPRPVEAHVSDSPLRVLDCIPHNLKRINSSWGGHQTYCLFCKCKYCSLLIQWLSTLPVSFITPLFFIVHSQSLYTGKYGCLQHSKLCFYCSLKCQCFCLICHIVTVSKETWHLLLF